MVEDQPKSFYTTFEEKGDNVTCSDEGFDEIAINFVQI